MTKSRLFSSPLLLTASLLVLPAAALAQSQPALEDRWPAPAQQMEQRAPAAGETPAADAPAAAPAAKPKPKPRAARKPPAPAADAPAAEAPPAVATPRATAATARAGAAAAAKPSATNRTIACNGVFGRDSNHLALATAFDPKNVTFAEVDGPEGSKLNASVVFPNDPKRRLEVLWQDEAARKNTSLVVVGGQSTWTGPKGLKLGLALAALEKVNGKPFKLRGFDQENPGGVIDWDGGVLADLPGGCAVGIRLAADQKIAEAVRAKAFGKEFLSSDAAIQAVKPTVAEIVFGYPDAQ